MPRAKRRTARARDSESARGRCSRRRSGKRITTGGAPPRKLDVSEAAPLPPLRLQGPDVRGADRVQSRARCSPSANRITEDEADGRRQCDKLVEMLLAFAEKKPPGWCGRHDRRRAGRRARAAAGAHETSFFEALRVDAQAVVAGGLRRRCGGKRPARLIRYLIGLPAPVLQERFFTKETHRELGRASVVTPRGLARNPVLT